MLSYLVVMWHHCVQHNGAMPTYDEKVAFSKRLEFALRRSPEAVNGASELALRFNLLYEEGSISPQTAHKWLTARAIPKNDKLARLAEWLNVDEHWLHYGPPPSKQGMVKNGKAAKAANSAPSPDTVNLALKIQALPPERRYLLEELVNQLQDKF